MLAEIQTKSVFLHKYLKRIIFKLKSGNVTR